MDGTLRIYTGRVGPPTMSLNKTHHMESYFGTHPPKGGLLCLAPFSTFRRSPECRPSPICMLGLQARAYGDHEPTKLIRVCIVVDTLNRPTLCRISGHSNVRIAVDTRNLQQVSRSYTCQHHKRITDVRSDKANRTPRRTP